MPKIEYNGINFDSQLEVEYYKYLSNESKCSVYTYHPKPIELTKGNSYTPDFITEYEDRIEIIETKGYNQYSYLRDTIVDNMMKAKSEEELKKYVEGNGWVVEKPVVYRKLKYLKSYGWVDFSFKNPNTLSNKRKEKIKQLEQEVKRLKVELKDAKKYIKLSKKANLSNKDKEFLKIYEEANK